MKNEMESQGDRGKTYFISILLGQQLIGCEGVKIS